MPAISRLLFCFAGVLLPVLASSAPVDSSVETVLHDLRQAYGGDLWNHVAAIESEGRETADGMSGAWQALVDIRSGQFISRSRNELFSTDEGFDAAGRWHLGLSGMVGPEDSDEAKAIAISESWLYRYGYLMPQLHATYRLLADAEEQGHRYIRMEATPDGGHTLTLWIDPATHRLDRAVWNGSFLQWTQRYADYRPVDGMQLPHRVVTSSALASGASHGTITDIAEHVRVLSSTRADDLKRPSSAIHDVTMASDAPDTSVPMHVEGGIVLIEASINGKEPMPFILDTGGSAILTADAAKRLGVQSKGSGVSAGSGPGSMSTAYTKIDSLTLGDATIHDQTFVVMPFPYSFYQRGAGHEPIAGILGLEIFQRFAVTFDYDRQRLILQPFNHGDTPTVGQGDVLPMRFTFDMPLIHAALDGQPGIFGVDTGNSGYTLLFPQWAEHQGLSSHYEKGLPYLTGGAGGLYTAHLAHAHSFQLGKSTLNNVLAMLTRPDAGATGNPSEAGNMGQDILSRFNVHFDYRREEMVLMPRASVPEWHYAMAGFRAEKVEAKPDRYQVAAVIAGSPAEQAGLKKGDEIMAIDGKPAASLGVGAFWDLVSLRPEGSLLALTLVDGRTLTMKLRDIAPR